MSEFLFETEEQLQMESADVGLVWLQLSALSVKAGPPAAELRNRLDFAAHTAAVRSAGAEGDNTASRPAQAPHPAAQEVRDPPASM